MKDFFIFCSVVNIFCIIYMGIDLMAADLSSAACCETSP